MSSLVVGSRKGHRDDELPGSLGDFHSGIIPPIGQLQARLQPAKAGPGHPRCGGGVLRETVPNHDPDSITIASDLYPHGPSGRRLGDAMPNRVFDQWLKDERRDSRVEQCGIDTGLESKAFTESERFECEVFARELPFLSQ